MDERTREAAWAAYADALECKLELATIARETSAIKLILAERKLAALRWQLKYRPDQPRVPAGYREGGQWTLDGAGAPSAHPRRRSPTGFVDQPPPYRPPPGSISERDDRAPDLGAIFGIGTAEAAERPPPRPGYKVSLPVHELLGGHTILRHVGKSDGFLRRRLLLERIPAASTFSTVQAAEKIINATLSENAPIVEAVKSGAIKDYVAITSKFDRPVGRAWVRGAQRPVTTDIAQVWIVHDPLSPQGFLVVTAFPVDPNEKFP